MSELKKLLLEFEQALKKNNATSLKALQHGLTNDEISNLLLGVEILFSEELHILYNWRNGIKYDSEWAVGEFNLFSFGLMLSLEDVIKHQEILRKSKNIECKFLLPLFATGNGDYVLYQADTKSNECGRLCLYAPAITLSEKPVLIYDSLRALLQTLIECYKQGVYKVNDDGSLDVNYELEERISRNINMHAEFWG